MGWHGLCRRSLTAGCRRSGSKRAQRTWRPVPQQREGRRQLRRRRLQRGGSRTSCLSTLCPDCGSTSARRRSWAVFWQMKWFVPFLWNRDTGMPPLASLSPILLAAAPLWLLSVALSPSSLLPPSLLHFFSAHLCLFASAFGLCFLLLLLRALARLS